MRGVVKNITGTLPKTPQEWIQRIQEYSAHLNEFIQEGEKQEFKRIFFMSARGNEDRE